MPAPPKTGTWSLQFHLGTHRRELMAEGWWFPAPSDTPEPKHQQVNALLRRDDPDGFVRYVESALADMPDDAHTVLLTTEGIFNHWWDYAPRAKGVLRQLAALFDFELCVWFRPPEDFAAALYAQYLRNPRRPTESMGNVYGRDIDFTEALADHWFRGHLDYLGFYREAQALFGASRVKAFRFADDTVTTFLEHYRLAGLPGEAARRNTSLGRAGVDLMRIANRHALNDDEQAHVADLVRDIDSTIGERAERFRLTAEERQLVQRFGAPGWRTLQPLLVDGNTPARRRVLKPKVFCIGFHRTGTKSLAQALRSLGYRVAGPTGAQNPAIAERAVAMALALATEYDAFNDNPWPAAVSDARRHLSRQPVHPDDARRGALDPERGRVFRHRGDADAPVDLRARHPEWQRGDLCRALPSAQRGSTRVLPGARRSPGAGPGRRPRLAGAMRLPRCSRAESAVPAPQSHLTGVRGRPRPHSASVRVPCGPEARAADVERAFPVPRRRARCRCERRTR